MTVKSSILALIGVALAIGLLVGTSIGRALQESTQPRLISCYDACMGLILLTPDDPDAMREGMERSLDCVDLLPETAQDNPQ